MAFVAAIRAFAIAAWLLVTAFPCWLVYLSGARRLQGYVQQLLFGVVLKIMNTRLHVHGAPDPARPLLLVTNHMSYVDVLALGTVTPVHFTPKAEIASWPVIGFFCKLAGCVFIDRRRSRTAENRQQLQEALEAGVRLCLFPEGTTSDGTEIMPFRSSFFDVAEGGALTVQCGFVRYAALNGKPIDPTSPNPLAWYGDADFFPHFWQTLKARSIDAEVHLLEAFRMIAGRKEIAARCEGAIRDAQQRLLPAAG